MSLFRVPGRINHIAAALFATASPAAAQAPRRPPPALPPQAPQYCDILRAESGAGEDLCRLAGAEARRTRDADCAARVAICYANLGNLPVAAQHSQYALGVSAGDDGVGCASSVVALATIAERAQREGRSERIDCTAFGLPEAAASAALRCAQNRESAPAALAQILNAGMFCSDSGALTPTAAALSVIARGGDAMRPELRWVRDGIPGGLDTASDLTWFDRVIGRRGATPASEYPVIRARARRILISLRDADGEAARDGRLLAARALLAASGMMGVGHGEMVGEMIEDLTLVVDDPHHLLANPIVAEASPLPIAPLFSASIPAAARARLAALHDRLRAFHGPEITVLRLRLAMAQVPPRDHQSPEQRSRDLARMLRPFLCDPATAALARSVWQPLVRDLAREGLDASLGSSAPAGHVHAGFFERILRTAEDPDSGPGALCEREINQ